MTVVSLQAESATANPSEFQILWRAWRRAKAEWELAETAPDKPLGLEIEESDAFCDIEQAALNAMLLHPAGELSDVVMKLRAFQTEEVFDARNVREVLERLVKDVRRFAYGFE
jgi:hypothetical protein